MSQGVAWEPTGVVGIRRDKKSGLLYFRKRIAGREFSRSLKTHDMSVATERAKALEAEIRAELAHEKIAAEIPELGPSRSKGKHWQTVHDASGNRIPSLLLHAPSGTYYVKKQRNEKLLFRSTGEQDFPKALVAAIQMLEKWSETGSIDSCPHCGKPI